MQICKLCDLDNQVGYYANIPFHTSPRFLSGDGTRVNGEYGGGLGLLQSCWAGELSLLSTLLLILLQTEPSRIKAH